MLTLVAVLAGLTVFTLVLAVTRPNRDPGIQRRLARLSTDDYRDPYGGSFAERVIAPTVRRVGRISTIVLPQRLYDSIQERLERAGRPLSTPQFITLWVGWAAVLPLAIVLLLFTFTGFTFEGIDGLVWLIAFAAWAVLGLVAPWMWLRSMARRRTRAIDRSLPDAIDLIVTNVEAGLGLQAAMLSVAEKLAGPISAEFARVAREVSVGRSREEALMSMAQRCDTDDMRLFAHAVAQAERTGISIGRVLRGYSREQRERRRQRAREAAGRIPMKITVPTVLFIFPTLFIIVLGPVAIRVMDSFGELDAF